MRTLRRLVGQQASFTVARPATGKVKNSKDAAKTHVPHLGPEAGDHQPQRSGLGGRASRTTGPFKSAQGLTPPTEGLPGEASVVPALRSVLPRWVNGGTQALGVWRRAPLIPKPSPGRAAGAGFKLVSARRRSSDGAVKDARKGRWSAAHLGLHGKPEEHRSIPGSAGRLRSTRAHSVERVSQPRRDNVT